MWAALGDEWCLLTDMGRVGVSGELGAEAARESLRVGVTRMGKNQ